MSHDEFVERLNDFLDGSLEEPERRAVASHLKDCVSCRNALDELRSILEEARALPSYEASPEVWDLIRSRLGDAQPKSWTKKAPVWLAIAASLLAGAGLWMLVGQSRSGVPEDQDELVMMVTDELRAADAHYQNAIDGLEQIIAQNQGVLPPELNAVLEENLDLIQAAIDESRQALSREPENSVAQESLLSALRRKVSLLQNTILLINEVRKGEGENALDRIEEIRQTNPSPNSI